MHSENHSGIGLLLNNSDSDSELSLKFSKCIFLKYEFIGCEMTNDFYMIPALQNAFLAMKLMSMKIYINVT